MGGCGCGPCGDPARPGIVDRAFRGDPAARKLLALQAQPEIGKLLPTFVTPDVVRAQKNRLHPAFVTTDGDVQRCEGLPPAKKAAWAAFFASWIAYRNAPDSFWGTTSEFDAGVIFEKSLQGWQDDVSSSCAMSAPRLKSGEDTEPDLSAVKWAAAAVIAVALVVGLRSVWK